MSGGELSPNTKLLNNPYGYNGEYHDLESGLQYLRARYYNPESARFITRDSYLGEINEPFSLNRYAYTLNNPVKYKDPSGNGPKLAGDDIALQNQIDQEYLRGKSNSSVGNQPLIEWGSRGDSVLKVQNILDELGYYLGPSGVDGVYGKYTNEAIEAYQTRNGLQVDGKVGPETWGSFNGYVNKKAAESKGRSNNSNACDDLGGGVVSGNGTQVAGKDVTFIEGVLDSADKRLNSFLNTVTFGNAGTDDVGAFFLMMDKDEDGIYHARFDGWQQFGGYNSFYDAVFDHATSIKAQPYEFTYDSQDYRLWACKGDYLNLGAGAELGLYKRLSVFGNETDHWLVDTSLALPMTLTLKDNKGNLIDSYNPSEPQWWITAFNPNRPDVNAEDLRVTYTVDFSENKGMFDAFYKQLYGKDARLTFDKKNYTTTLNF